MNIRRSAVKAFVVATLLALALIVAITPHRAVTTVSAGSLQFETEYL